MKSKIRWFSALLALILSLVIGFSSNSTQTEAAKKEAPLKIGMEANYPPYNWTQTTDANGAVPIDGSSNMQMDMMYKSQKLSVKSFIVKLSLKKPNGMVYCQL